MSRTMLTLMLFAVFGIMATLQAPLLFKSSVKIPGLQGNSFMDANKFAQTLQTYYKQHPADLPNSVYVFSVTLENNKKPANVLNLVRDMKSIKQIFADSSNGYVTNYFRYNKSAEVSESLLNSLKTLNVEYHRNMSSFHSFEKELVQRTKSSKFAADIVSLPLKEIKLFDSFLIRMEKVLAEKSDGKYIIAVTFDSPKSANPTKLAMTEEEYISTRRMLQATQNSSNTTNGTTLSISSSTFTGLSVGLFVTVVTIIAVGLLCDIKTPGSFISVPLHIGKEH